MEIILIILALLLLGFIFKRVKRLKTPCITLISGAVKGGKTTLAVHLALSTYRKTLLRYYILAPLRFIMRKKAEKPLLYSNIPLKCKYVPMTRSLFMREERFAFKSVVLLDEASLVADSQLYKDQDINEQLLLFTKLFGHETHNGKLIINTQSYDDLHYSFSRCIDSCVYVHHTLKHIPFILVSYVRELKVGDTYTQNNITEDIEISLRPIIYLKRVWKKFDYCAFSELTDNIPVADKVIDNRKAVSLKLDEKSIFTFRPYKHLKGGKTENEKNINK